MRIVLALFTLLLPALVFAAEQNHDTYHDAPHDAPDDTHHDAPPGEPQTIELSPQLRQLLQQEMQQIRSGMETLVFAMAAADWQKIEATAADIQSGYIMKQALSAEQRHELHRALPSGFIALDQRFHYYAGMLSHVARERDMELANFFVYKMQESCSNCHAKYASARFPGFNLPNKHEGH